MIDLICSLNTSYFSNFGFFRPANILLRLDEIFCLEIKTFLADSMKLLKRKESREKCFLRCFEVEDLDQK